MNLLYLFRKVVITLKIFLTCLVALIIYFYIEGILSILFKLRKTNILINKYSNIDINLNSDALADSIKQMVTPDMPVIGELLIYSWDSISLIQSTDSTINSFKSILSSLQSEAYSLEHDLKKSFYPSYALQRLFLIPSQILTWFGLKLTLKSERILSLLLWIGGFTINNYGKDIISFVVNNFVNHK